MMKRSVMEKANNDIEMKTVKSVKKKKEEKD